jgi:hypothetical protein
MPVLKLLLPYIIKIVVWTLLIIGVVAYYFSSLSGAQLNFSSLTSFLQSTGACTGDTCDISGANGCLLCGQITELINAIGITSGTLFSAIASHLWILLVLGFAIYMIVSAFQTMKESLDNAIGKDGEISDKQNDIKFDYTGWWNKLWKLGLRVAIVGMILGAISSNTIGIARTLNEITIKPIMQLGAGISMKLANVPDQMCDMTMSENEKTTIAENNIITPDTIKPMMCVSGLINTVSIAGASGGFVMMNLAWMQGEYVLWFLGLLLVIFFAFYGLKLFFELMNVVFQVIFYIIYTPVIIASFAFNGVWPIMKNISSGVIKNLTQLAINMIAITLKIVIFYSIIQFAADKYYPGPVDGYNSIFPPEILQNQTAASASTSDTKPQIANVMMKCEIASKENGVINEEKFKSCWKSEEKKNPAAFEFLKHPLDFILMLLFLMLFYFYAVESRLTKQFAKFAAVGSTNFGEQMEKAITNSIGWIEKIGGNFIKGKIKK